MGLALDVSLGAFTLSIEGVVVLLEATLNAVINKMWPAVLPPEDDNGATW